MPQGHEIHYATNHLGHYCLTRLLLNELLANKARVVVVDSMLHSLAFRWVGSIRFATSGLFVMKLCVFTFSMNNTFHMSPMQLT